MATVPHFRHIRTQLMKTTLSHERLLHLAGLACALILLLGRWTPARFLGYGVFPPFYVDLRIYLTAGCMVLLFTMRHLVMTKDSIAVLVMLAGLVIYILTVAAMDPVIGLDVRDFDYIDVKIVDVCILICLVFLFYWFGQQPEFEDHLWRWVFRISLVLTVLGGVSALVNPITYDERLTVLAAGGGNFFSRIVGITAVLTAFHIGRGDRPAWLFLGGLALAFVVVILSGSRGATISAAVAIGVVLLLSRRRTYMTVLFTFAVAAIAALFLLLPADSVDFLRVRYVDQLADTVYLAGRDILFAQVTDFWQSSPVFGHGIGSFSLVSSWEYPHNLIFEVLSEFGIVGACLLFGPLLYLLWVSLGRRRYVDHRTVGVLVLFFIAAQVSGDIYDSRMVFLLPVIMAAGALARMRQEAEGEAVGMAALPAGHRRYVGRRSPDLDDAGPQVSESPVRPSR
jgi:O-antigen ligase